MKRRWRRPSAVALLVIALTAAVVIDSRPDVIQRRLDQITGPYAWSVVGWEVEHLGDAFTEMANQVLRPPMDADIVAQVREYLAADSRPDGTASSSHAPPPVGEKKRARDVSTLRSLLAAAVAMELRAHGAPTVGHVVFPPVTLTLTRPLRLLVVSPRDQIRQSHWELFDDRFPATLTSEMEAKVEALGVSALVVDGIAVATYPALIPIDTPPRAIFHTVAHEWAHTALYFTPLGRAYGASPQLRAINETAADVVGNEIGDALLRRAGVEPPRAAAGGGSSPFAARMRAIRQRVDELLEQGDIVAAEAYMEEERQRLVADGYPIRRLNQAYFAFHGNYAEGPAPTTEVPDAIRALRAQSSSLAEFLDRVGAITSLDDLRAAALDAQGGRVETHSRP